MPKTRALVVLLAAGLWLAPLSDLSAADSALPRFGFDDWLLAPVRVHLLSAPNAPAIHTTLTEADVQRILKKMNGIWSQAGLSLWLESIVREEATNQTYGATMGQPDDMRGLLTLRPAASRATNMFHLYYVKRFSVNGVYLGEAMFVKDTASLRRVPGGIDEPLPRVSAHELGHALTLQHCPAEQHLMYRGSTGTNFDAGEIHQARAAAEKIPWVERASALFAKAAAGEKGSAAGKALYSRVAVIPLDAGPVRRAKQRSSMNEPLRD